MPVNWSWVPYKILDARVCSCRLGKRVCGYDVMRDGKEVMPVRGYECTWVGGRGYEDTRERLIFRGNYFYSGVRGL